MEEAKALPVVSDVFPGVPKPARPQRQALQSRQTLVRTPGGFERALLEGKPAPRSARISTSAALPPDALQLLTNYAPPYRPRAETVFVVDGEGAAPSSKSQKVKKAENEDERSLSSKLAAALGFQQKQRDPSPTGRASQDTTSTTKPRPGLISSDSEPWLAPRTWQDFNQLYVDGQIDLSKPPEPPVSIASRFPSPNFPQKQDSLDAQFAAPISPLELIRQQAVTRYKVLIPSPPSDTASSSASVEVPSLARGGSSASSHAYSVHTPSQAHHAQYASFSTLLARVERVLSCRWISISLMLPDDERFLASKGFPAGMKGIPREISFASHAILREEPMVVNDIALDWRFRRGPLAEVLGVRFYAGVSLSVPTSAVDPRPIAIGVLSCLDDSPLRLSDDRLRALSSLAKEISREIERLSGSATLDAFPSYIPAALSSSTSVKPRNMTALERRFIDWRTQLAQDASSVAHRPSVESTRSTRRRGSDDRPSLEAFRRRASDDTRSIAMDRRSTSLTTPTVGRATLPLLPAEENRRPSVPDAFAPGAFATVALPPPPPPKTSNETPSPSTPKAVDITADRKASTPVAATSPADSRPEQFDDAPSASDRTEQQPPAVTLPTVIEESRESSIAPAPDEGSAEPGDRRLRVFSAACNTVGRGLKLDFVYIVSLRIRPLLFAAGHEELDIELLASYQLPTPAPHFQASLHLRALKSPAGGLLYRNPNPTATDGFAGGILIPIIECKPDEENIISETTARGEGEALLICGFWKDRKKQFTEDELNALTKIAERIRTSIEDEEI